MACREALTPPGARTRLLAATETDTAYGRVFDVAQRLDWPPEYGGRGLRNPFFTHWAGREDALAGDDATAARYREARDAGDYDTAVVYAGQGVALLRRRAQRLRWSPSSAALRSCSRPPPRR